MARPTRLKIGLYTFPVRWVKQCTPPGFDDYRCDGYMSYRDSDRHISIGTDDYVSGDAQECLLHEVMHAINVDRGLNMLFQDDDAEELFVSSFAKGLLAVLRENKSLGGWLVE